jgi:glutamate-ammonia-ligase adenylyltransferase
MNAIDITPALVWTPTGAHPATEGFAGALAAARAGSPYLDRLAALEPELAAQIAADDGEDVFLSTLTLARDAADQTLDDGMRTLRIAKRRAHLAIAVADLAGIWSLERVTEALSALADVAVDSALKLAARLMIERGEMRVVEPDLPGGPVPGLVLVAMGKHGARELNYSSDIDFSVFFDADFLPAAGRDPKRLAVKLAQAMVRILEEVTVDGYVFRTDLRLRPDPGSTPIAVSIAAAERYYQSLGQNWERAAFIKARPLAGDLAATQAFLDGMQSFIWRRYLDYAAIDDIRSIKRQILSVHKSADMETGVFDVKLGRGGIRDIELFAQTQQLIFGGRDFSLRTPRTLDALAALVGADKLNPADAETLSRAYRAYRAVEHRIQMLADEQTHRPPQDGEGRSRLATLCGFQEFSALDALLLERRRQVAAIDASLFDPAESLAAPEGPLVFTGVEDHPDTLSTLRKMGFNDPVAVSNAVRGWHHGRVRAMRNARARELLTALTPALLRAIADSGDPDGAFARFAHFMEALPAGVQFFALLQAQPQLLSDLADIMGLSPLLADTLARRTDLLDSLLGDDFRRDIALDAPGARASALSEFVEEQPFEGAINAARRFHREEYFRIGLQLLQGRASAAEAGAAYTDLADACVSALADAALREVERLHGAAPGRYAVLALGKFGGGELSARSDLDLMLVYDAPIDARSGGLRALGPGEFFTKVAQRLLSALSAPTEEGLLYDVDMQLRPSGRKGPVAVRASAFASYYRNEAWTWELMALTRARPAAGDDALIAELNAVAAEALAAPRDGAGLLADAADMRARLDRDRPGKPPWDLKLAPGGFVDIEFIAQALALAHAPKAIRANTGAALEALEGVLTFDDQDFLLDTWRLYTDMNQLLQICLPTGHDIHMAPRRVRTMLAEKANVSAFAALETLLTERQKAVRAIFTRLVSG